MMDMASCPCWLAANEGVLRGCAEGGRVRNAVCSEPGPGTWGRGCERARSRAGPRLCEAGSKTVFIRRSSASPRLHAAWATSGAGPMVRTAGHRFTRRSSAGPRLRAAWATGAGGRYRRGGMGGAWWVASGVHWDLGLPTDSHLAWTVSRSLSTAGDAVPQRQSSGREQSRARTGFSWM